jgi:hypothetical protein
LGTRTAAQWNRYYSDDALDEFETAGLVFFNHSYPVWVSEKNGCWEVGPDGRARVAPEFDAVLARMARRRSAGTLDVPPVSQVVEHLVSLRSLSISPRSPGEIVVTNEGHSSVQDATFVASLPMVLEQDGKKTRSKSAKDGHVIVLTLAPGAKAALRTLEGATASEASEG